MIKYTKQVKISANFAYNQRLEFKKKEKNDEKMQEFKEKVAKMIEEVINSGGNLNEINMSLSEVLINYMYGGLPGQRFMLNVQNQCPNGAFKLSEINAYSLMTLLVYDWIRKGILPLDHNPDDLQAFTEMLCKTCEELSEQLLAGNKMQGFNLKVEYTEPAEKEQTENEATPLEDALTESAQ